MEYESLLDEEYMSTALKGMGNGRGSEFSSYTKPATQSTLQYIFPFMQTKYMH